MGVLVQTRVAATIVLGLALSVISGATPNKALETVEIDGKGAQKTKTHEVQHDAHEAKPIAAEQSHAKEASHDGKEPHKVHDAKKPNEPVHGGVSHAPEPKGKEHLKHSDKEQPPPASMTQHSAFSDEEEDDAALDELEAMTIARTFEKKAAPPWGPPAAVPCRWNEWEDDGSCAFTCGGRGKTGQKQARGKNPPQHGGSGCHGKTTKSVECAIQDCPTTVTTTEEEATTTTAGGAPRMANLSFSTLVTSLLFALSLLGLTGH